MRRLTEYSGFKSLKVITKSRIKILPTDYNTTTLRYGIIAHLKGLGLAFVTKAKCQCANKLMIGIHSPLERVYWIAYEDLNRADVESILNYIKAGPKAKKTGKGRRKLL